MRIIREYLQPALEPELERRVVETGAVSFEREQLHVLVIYPEGERKQEIRKENPYCIKHGVLYQTASGYVFK